MAISVNEVERLNEKIEGLNTTRTKTETRKEMLTQSLEKELKEYADLYGVNLQGNKFSQTYRNIQEEAKKVSEQIKEEYELKLKVVSAIESGDIDEANKLLGIEDKSEEVEEEVEEGLQGTSEESESDEGDFTEEDFGELSTPEDKEIPDGMSPIEVAVQDIDEEDEDEDNVESLGGLNIGKDFLVDEDEDEDDDVEGFSMEDFTGEKFLV